MKNRFMKGQRIVINEREYSIEDRHPSGDLKLKDSVTSSCLLRPMDALIQELFNGKLKILNQDASYVSRKAANILSEDFTQLPEDQRAEAKRKYAYIKEIMAQHPDGRAEKLIHPIIEAVAKAIGDANPPCPITLYRWRRDFTSSGENIRSLVPLKKMKGNRRAKVSPEVESIIDRAIAEKYLTEQRLTVPAVHNSVIDRIADENRFKDDKLTSPNVSTIYRRILKLNPYEVTKKRYGKRIADAKFRALKQGVETERILQRVEIDHTKLDLFVIDTERGMPIGRPWLTTAIDVYSKTIFGIYMSFNPPSYLSLMQCLLHGIRPKAYVKGKYPHIKHTWDTYGIPETVVVDNGKEFHSTHFEDACLQLGIVVQYSPVKLAWYRPSIERHFGTINKELLHQQPGTSFSNILEKADYDPAKNAIIDFETLLEITHKWIIDVYHQKEHGGINNIPALAWKAGVEEFPPALPPNRDELEVLLGMIGERTISSSGIELHGLFYNSDELASVRCGDNKRVRIKFDPTDLSIIHVFDEVRGAFIPVPALKQSYAQGLTLWQHNVIRAYARKYIKDNVDGAALARAKEEIREIVASAWLRTKKNITRQKMMRFKSSGRMLGEDVKGKEKREAIPFEAGRKLIPMYAGDSALCGISDGGGCASEGEDMPGAEAAGIVVPLEKKRRDGKKLSADKNYKQKTKATGQEKDGVPSQEDEDLDMSGWSADYNRPGAER
jgi:putative transposase